MSKLDILQVLGLLGKQEQPTKASVALQRVPQKYADLFKDGNMPVPEFETIPQPQSVKKEFDSPHRKPKRELRPGYRWKFNGTGAFGRKMFIQVPIEDEVPDYNQRAEAEAQELVQEYFTHTAPKTRDTFEPKSSPGRFRDAGKIVAIEPISYIENADSEFYPHVLLTFHSYYGFQDSDGVWASGLVNDSRAILSEINILKNLSAKFFSPIVSFVKNGATTTVFLHLETFRKLDQFMTRTGKDVIVDDNLIREILNIKK